MANGEVRRRIVDGVRRVRHRVLGGESMVGADGIVVVERAKLAYVAIPKAANSSVKAVLAGLLEAEMGDLFDAEWPPDPFRTPEGRVGLTERGILISAEELASRTDLTVFTVVRHPLDRLVSCWSNKLHSTRVMDGGLTPGFAKLGGFSPGMPFTDFARRIVEIDDRDAEIHFRSQTTFLVDRDGSCVADVVVPFEDMSTQLQRVLADHGIVDIEVPHLLASDRAPWQSYYDSTTAAMVGERYRADLERFGYELPESVA